MPSGKTPESIRKEIQDLERELHEISGGVPRHIWKPSGITVGAIALGLVILFLIAFLAGYTPLQKRTTVIASETSEQTQALPRVETVEVSRSTKESDLELPGNIQAIAEAPILARAEGYIEKRLVDIGDRVKAGQTLAEIDAPEIDQQVHQAQASVEQGRASFDQATANLQQGQAELELARVNSERWATLVKRGAVSKQENDQIQAQYQSRIASVHALEKAVEVQRRVITGAQANVSRLEKLEAYRVVKAPFDGVITQRNVDVGALVNAGQTLLFRIAQTDKLRIYVNIPQSHSNAVRAGQQAKVTVSNMPGREFIGTVSRSANALDPASRTLLMEVHLDNAGGTLLPGMFAQVVLNSSRPDPPFLLPSNALLLRTEGAQVAVVRPDNTVHLQKVDVERDFGDRIEIVNGLQAGDRVVVNPGDVVSEGLRVDPVAAMDKDSGAAGRGK